MIANSAEREPRHDPDVCLMLEVRAGCEEAFEELFRRHSPWVVSLMQSSVGDAALAEDLAQEVFLRVYRARANYQPTAKFTTWLFTIASNVARNAIRAAVRRREICAGQPADVEHRGGARGRFSYQSKPLQHMVKAEQVGLVQRAVDRLSGRQRTALQLFAFDSMSYGQIAETMGLTTEAVKSLLARARGNLRHKLAGRYQAATS